MDGVTKYFRDTASEMKQVKWPTKQQALVYSALVIAISLVVSLFLGAFDYVFGQFIDFIVNTY